jgi:hypothetical protein
VIAAFPNAALKRDTMAVSIAVALIPVEIG